VTTRTSPLRVESSGRIPKAESRRLTNRKRRLFADGKFFTPDARAKFFFDKPRPMPESPDADIPFLLLTGRGSSAQWHTGSRTDKSAVLRKLAPTGAHRGNKSGRRRAAWALPPARG